MQSLSAVLRGPAFNPPPPVRAGSRLAGTIEDDLWQPTPPRFVDAVVRGARELARAGWRARRAGGEPAPLGRLALAVLEELGRLVDWGTGRLEPSYEELAQRAGASRSGVHLALKQLRAAGLVTSVPRYERTGLDGERGPQVRQIANAYRLVLPPAAERALALAGEVTAALSAQVRALRAAEREARAARWAEARARRETVRMEMAEARDRAASRAPEPPSPAAPRQSDKDAFAAVLAQARRLLGDPPERESSK